MSASAGAPRRIGYLVPEFPGQTHAFFWREVRALAALGVEADLLSTRRPERRIVCHAWSKEAIQRTTYLFPPGAGRGVGAAVAAAQRLSRVVRCLRMGPRVGLGGAKGRAKMSGLVFTAANLAALARARGWTHVHVHSCADAALVAFFAKVLGGPTYSLTLHGAVEDYGAGQAAKWGGAAFGFVVSRALLPGLLEAAPALDAEKVAVAPMGVDVDAFTRATPYQPATAGDAWRVVSCGRLHPGKGHLDLVRAIALQRGQGRRVEARIVGEGEARGAIEALVGELGVQDCVTLLGALPEARVRDELAWAHVFALASHQEALGVATMEAMAMGLPVVASRVGGVPELVRHGVDGLLVPARDSAALAAALGTVLEDPELAARLGRSGAERVRAEFHSGVSAGRLAERLAALRSGSGAAAAGAARSA